MALPSGVSGYAGGYGTTSAAHTMQPTWQGFVHSTHDALMILEACLAGRLSHIPRRPHDRERSSLIASGNIFVYEENASGIKRWTDGMTWSPSRIMGNFLVYRELNPNNYASGEKKVARKRKRSVDLGSGDNNVPKMGSPSVAEEDRRLVGSLVDSYGFKPDGLVKRTLTVQYNNVAHHLISYYTVKDVKDGKLKRPEFDPNIRGIQVRSELMNHPFKQPIHDAEDMDPGNGQQLAGAVVPIGSRHIPYPQSFAVQPAIQSYHGVPHPAARDLHPIQTQYSSSGFVGSHAMHVAVHPQYGTHVNTHISNGSSLSASPISHSPSPIGYNQPITFDSPLQVSYISKDQRVDSLVNSESQQRFLYDEPLTEEPSIGKRQKLSTSVENNPPPATTNGYYDHGFDPITTTYPASNDLPVSTAPTAGSYSYTASHDFANGMNNGHVSGSSYDSYGYGKVPVHQDHSIAHGFDDGYDTYPLGHGTHMGWGNAGFTDMHPITTASIS